MSETIDQSPEIEQTDPAAVGEILRGGREARGLTVANVAQMLKLGVRQVEAMEAGRFDLLPGPAFVRGFLRNYARLLGLDAEPLVAAVDAGPTSAARVELSPVSNADGVMPVSGERRMSSTPVVLVAFGLLLVVLVGWYFDWFRTPGQPANELALPTSPEIVPQNEPLFPPPPSAEDVGEPGLPAQVAVEPVEPSTADEGAAPRGESAAAQPAEPAPPPAQPAPVPATPAEPAVQASATGGSVIELRFAGESWFEVRDASGNIVATGTGSAGQVRSVRGTAPLALVIGNAGQVRLSHNGQAVDLVPHTRVSVARLTLQ